MSVPVEIPALIDGSVPAIRLARALADAGLVVRHDGVRNVLVIEPAAKRLGHRCKSSGATERR